MYRVRRHSPAIAQGISWLVLLAACCIALAGCSKKEEDPVEYVKAMIPKIQQGLNDRDIAGLKSLGTSKFEANRFITDVFAHGVHGDVTLELVRVRSVPGDVRLILRALFDGGQGGVKELSLFYAGERDWKIDTYSLRDKSLPEPEPGDNVFDSLPPQTAPTDPS